VDPLERIAEQRLADALARGELSNPLAGQPLDLEADARVPAELRAGFRLLKGAGMLPPELEARGELLRLEDLLAACRDEEERGRLARARSLAAVRYELLMERRGWSRAALDYREQVRSRLG
jgi:hypothetical protein